MQKTDERLICLLEVLQLIDLSEPEEENNSSEQTNLFSTEIEENQIETEDVDESNIANADLTLDGLDNVNQEAESEEESTEVIDKEEIAEVVAEDYQETQEIDPEDLLENVTLPDNIEQILEDTEEKSDEDTAVSDFDYDAYNSVDFEEKQELKLNSDVYDSYDLSVTAESADSNNDSTDLVKVQDSQNIEEEAVESESHATPNLIDLEVVDTTDSGITEDLSDPYEISNTPENLNIDTTEEESKELIGYTISSALKDLEGYVDIEEPVEEDSEEYKEAKMYLETLILQEGIQVGNKQLNKKDMYDFSYDFESNISIDLDDDWFEDEDEEEGSNLNIVSKNQQQDVQAIEEEITTKFKGGLFSKRKRGK